MAGGGANGTHATVSRRCCRPRPRPAVTTIDDQVDDRTQASNLIDVLSVETTPAGKSSTIANVQCGATPAILRSPSIFCRGG